MTCAVCAFFLAVWWRFLVAPVHRDEVQIISRLLLERVLGDHDLVIILLGDFNANLLNTSKPRSLDILDLLSLHQILEEPTRMIVHSSWTTCMCPHWVCLSLSKPHSCVPRHRLWLIARQTMRAWIRSWTTFLLVWFRCFWRCGRLVEWLWQASPCHCCILHPAPHRFLSKETSVDHPGCTALHEGEGLSVSKRGKLGSQLTHPSKRSSLLKLNLQHGKGDPSDKPPNKLKTESRNWLNGTLPSKAREG